MAKQLSPVFKGFSGSINHQLVFKQLNGQTVVTLYPDRSEVIFSERQRQNQRKFSDAVAFARVIIANPELKKIYSLKASLLNFRSAWNVAIAEYMSNEPLTLKPKKVRFDKCVITNEMGKNIHVNLYKRIPANYSNSGIITGKAPVLQKSGSTSIRTPFRKQVVLTDTPNVINLSS